MSANEIAPLTDFVLKAVQLGFLGFGALFLVMVFVILFRNQPADPDTAKLRMRFLTLGMAAFVFAGVAQLVTLMIAPKPQGSHQVAISFSPDLKTARLPQPAILVLPQRTEVQEDQPFTVGQDETISIKVDGVIEQARALVSAAQTLASANETLTQKLTTASNAQAAAGSAPAITTGEAQSLNTLSQDVKLKLQAGDFTHLARSTQALGQVTAMVKARTERAAPEG